jgi:DNA-binding response OmpR family regulator
MRVLVAEDDAKAARFLVQGLEEEGHAVDVAADGDAASRLGLLHPYDLIILDVMLPGRDGLEVAGDLRRGGITAPVLMLTARDSTGDVVRGLDAGADDYLTKPFAFDELLARVRALARRSAGEPHGQLRIGDLELDRVRRTVRRSNRRIDLAPREFRLLEHLMLHPEHVLTRTNLLDKVWDMTFDPGTNVVDAHISNLRRKLEDAGGTRLIHTVRGVGYVLRTVEL